MTTDLHIESIIAHSVALGEALALKTYGIVSGEKTYRQALAVYGRWFSEAVKAGRLAPVRVTTDVHGKARTQYYRVEDILALKVKEAAKPALIWRDTSRP